MKFQARLLFCGRLAKHDEETGPERETFAQAERDAITMLDSFDQAIPRDDVAKWVSYTVDEID